MARKRANPRTPAEIMAARLRHQANAVRESQLKQRLRLQLAERGLPEPPEEEYAIVPGRRFRGDLCYPFANPPVCIEIQGGRFLGFAGAHSSPTGLDRDYEKANLAQLAGFVYLQVTPEWVEDGTAVDLVERALQIGKEHADSAYGREKW